MLRARTPSSIKIYCGERVEKETTDYGQVALREPRKDRNGLVAWVMPIVAFLLGVLIVSFGLKKLTNKSELKNATQTDYEVISETEALILEKTFDEERRKRF